MALDQTVGRYYEECIRDPHSRYRSWEHCYRFFRKHCSELRRVENIAALQLGFYLASWGMYRGSSFLLRRTYTAHMPAIRALEARQFSNLWQHDVGTRSDDIELAEPIMALVESVKDAYKQFGNPTDTLATKVLLGTVGCLPACDRYFIRGFRAQRFRYSCVNGRFVGRILRFCIDNRLELTELQSMVIGRGGPRYPLMKLADMHFWQIGFDLASP